MELEEFGLEYQPRTAIKSQVLAGFIADFTCELQIEAEQELFSLQAAKTVNAVGQWVLLIDGSNNSKRTSLGVVLISPEGDVIERIVRCAFKTTNNDAKYKALIAGLSLAKDMSVMDLVVKSDSQLILSQVSRDFQTKDSRMVAYLELTKEFLSRFQNIDVNHVVREENVHVDALANLGSMVEAPCT